MILGGQYIIENPRWDREYRFWPIGDVHDGAAGCDEDLLQENVERIRKDSRARWWGMGDMWDLISWQDNRFDPEQIKGPDTRAAYFTGLASAMLQRGVERFGPIRKKCLGLLQGNHEWKFGLKNDHHLMRDLADNLKVPFLGYSAFKDTIFRDASREVRLRWYLHHGAGYAQTKGGKLNRLLRFVFTREADIAVMGHVHASIDDVTPILAANDACTHLVAKNRLGVISGTYLKAYQDDPDGSASYAERAGYEPTPLGSPVIVFTPGSRRVMVEKPMGRVGEERMIDDGEADDPD